MQKKKFELNGLFYPFSTSYPLLTVSITPQKTLSCDDLLSCLRCACLVCLPVHVVAAVIQKNVQMRLISRPAGAVRSDWRAPPSPAGGGIGVVLSQNRRWPSSADVNKNREDGTCGPSASCSVFVHFDPRFTLINKMINMSIRKQMLPGVATETVSKWRASVLNLSVPIPNVSLCNIC